MKSEVELFVPGRLCLFGEHSDWAGKYRNINPEIEPGYALVSGVEEGIYAKAKISEQFVIKTKEKKFESNMDIEDLKEIARSNNYFSYMAGVAAYVKENYNVGGLTIEITEETLPIKKGLSSSAAICVLVTRAFNQLYNLQLNTLGEMQIAYYGELQTQSRCGRLDQACAFGKKPVLMKFDGDNLNVEQLKIGADFYWVFADLMAQKDTIKILADLNKCYPFPQTEQEKKIHEGLGSKNKEITEKAVQYLKTGDAKSLGKLMEEAQKVFDEYVAPSSTELKSPILHKVLSDSKIKELSYGGKGVGSQGDGTVQFLVHDEKAQKELIQYLEENGMSAYGLKIPKSKTVKKAIIPVAGLGTRMYPITKLIKKCFLPITSEEGFIKPVIMVLLEELDKAGIEKFALVIDEGEQELYDKFFKTTLSLEYQLKLSSEMLEYEKTIKKIGKKIEYIVQKDKLGLGHAVSLCEKFVNKEPVLLVLGDQIYRSNEFKSCTEQVLTSFEETGKLTVSVAEIPLEDVCSYGILAGKIITEEKNSFEVSIMKEKPEIEDAKQYLYTMDRNVKKYYSVFGEYVLTPKVFEKLNEMIKMNEKSKGEYQITDALEKTRQEDGMIAIIPNGEMFDVGTPHAYKETLKRFVD